MLIDCRPPRRQHDLRDERFTQTNYEQSAPFFINPRGVLAHRVRSLVVLTATYYSHPWTIVEYWCENSGRTGCDDDGLEFDPGDRFVCKRCEELAVAHGELTSSELAGRHVCVGVCRPVNVCPEHGESEPTP